MKKVVYIGNCPVAMEKADVQSLLDSLTGKRKPGLKRAADKAWMKRAQG